MSEGEGFGEGAIEGQGPAKWPQRRTRELREQAEMAWNRVQQVVQQRRGPGISVDQLMEAVDSVPAGGYLGGIAGSIIASSWLSAMGHRTSATVVGLGTPLLLGIALYLKMSRRPQPEG